MKDLPWVKKISSDQVSDPSLMLMMGIIIVIVHYNCLGNFLSMPTNFKSYLELFCKAENGAVGEGVAVLVVKVGA